MISTINYTGKVTQPGYSSLRLGIRASFGEIVGKGMTRREEFYPLVANVMGSSNHQQQHLAITTSPAHQRLQDQRRVEHTILRRHIGRRASRASSLLP